MGKLQNLIADWLHQLDIPVSNNYVKSQLLAHPDYPSLASITDTLDELNIENTAIQIEKENLHEVPVPFLAHLRSNGGEFEIVKNRNDLEKQYPKFFERWSGVVVLVEKPVAWKHKENNVWLLKERGERIKIAASVGLLSAFIIASVLFARQWQQAALLFIAAAGTFISWLIASKDLGIENKLADQVCGKEGDCNAVIQSKGANLPLGIVWSDVGMVYFSFLLFSLLLFSFTKTNTSFHAALAPLSICALPLTLLSIYYQWRIVKKWCRLCLIIVGLLWTQFTITLNPMRNEFNGLQAHNTPLFVFVLFLAATTWLLIKNLLKENKKLETENFAGKRFKSNPEVFIALLEKQRRVDIAPFKNDLQIGNSDATLQVMVACNPYCEPCAKAHKILHELVEKNDIGMTVRFTIKTENKTDRKFKAAEYILQLSVEEQAVYKRKVLHDWSKNMNLDKFSDLYSLNGKAEANVDEILNQCELWSDEAKIQFTPTIFINGYELPKRYKVNDLKLLIKGISEKIKTEMVEPENELI